MVSYRPSGVTMAAIPTSVIIAGRSSDTKSIEIGVEKVFDECVCKMVGQSEEWKNLAMTDL